MFKNFEKLKVFLGPEVYRAYWYALLLGFGWFVTESGFVFILQGFLSALGLLNNNPTLLPSWYPTNILATSLILVFYGVLRSIVTYCRNYVSGYVGQTFNRYQRERFLTFGLNNVTKIKTHELISLFNERIQQSSTVLQYFVFFLINVVSLIFFLGFGLKLAPFELIVSLFLLAIFVWPFKFLNTKIETSGKSLIDEWNNVNKVLVQGFKNYFFLRVYGLIDQETEKGKKSLGFYEDHYKSFFHLASLKLAFPVFAGTLIVSFVTYLSYKYREVNGVVLISFYYVFIRITQAVADSSSMLSVVKLNLAGFKIMFEWNDSIEKFLAEKEKSLNSPIDSKLYFQDSLEAKNISFYYEKENPILESISFKLKKGDILVVKGESGAGKSTLLSLLLKVNEPKVGSILVDNQEIKNVSNNFLNQIGYVGPEPYLISGTVRENLLFGNHHIKNFSDEEMWNALSLAQIHSEVSRLKNQLSEELNEFTQLSTGQKQRLSLARAMLRKPAILILDEATANVDHANELRFIDELVKISKDMMIIVVSHKNTFDSIATIKLELFKK